MNDEAVEYISKYGGPINLIGDWSSYRYPAEQTISEQANVFRAKNPNQKQWAYYAIDLVRQIKKLNNTTSVLSTQPALVN